MEDETNKMFEEIGINELAVFESTGSLIVYEGANLETLKKTVCDVCENIMSVIKAAFEKIMHYFDEKMKENNKQKFKAVFDNRDAILEKLGADFTFTDISVVKTSWSNRSNEIQQIFQSIIKDFNDIKTSYTDRTELTSAAKEKLDEYSVVNILGKLTYVEVNDKSSRTTIANEFINEKLMAKYENFTVAQVKSYWGKITNATTKTEIKDKIKGLYKEQKKLVESSIKGYTPKTDEDTIVFSYKFKAGKNLMVAVNAYTSMLMDAMKMEYMSYLKILNRMLQAVPNTAAKQEPATEAANESVSQIDLVDQMFNW